ncbi:MAG TPA: chorismate synthase [candidate division Zixibacteria bacterium]|nr:chorismate synthase [candidate division Zixibacteria bacterium]MDD4918130.1 chorismate synthase [candidate division Zixibacteria bacterium]MDM7972073.1 chorismate synthase [candidate division Zixibacteria bacterium]HOD66139.1 chorismate synthase [candidate division Zixibacteria bacterium]HOZ08515.1 chorismate synthase [candidate division Zixibacteria bacterium]
MLTYVTAGESHGPQLTAILDGLPAGFRIDPAEVNYQLARRQKGFGRGGRMKIERDEAEFVSGVRGGVTMGGPITLVIRNRDWENWARIMHPLEPMPGELDLRDRQRTAATRRPRPGHADLPGAVKWNHHDMRNVLERASARETAARTALGALARQLLEHFGVEFASHVVRIGEVEVPRGYDLSDLTRVREVTEASEVRCLDAAAGERMIEAIRAARAVRDSLGGIVEIIVRGLPIGLGGFSQWRQRLDGRLAGALMAVPSVKGVEIGLGFAAAGRRGSEAHDEIFYDPDGDPRRKRFLRRTNNAGGIEGGVTNGEDVVVRVAGKPLSTLNRPLRTVDVATKEPGEAMVERTDTCAVPALGVIGEGVAALVLAEAFLEKFGADNLAETERNFTTYLDTQF